MSLSEGRYSLGAIVLHWLVVLLVVPAFLVGLNMHDLPASPLKIQVYSLHKWAGVTVFLFMIVRLVWRMTHKTPPLPSSVPVFQQRVAGLLHAALYLLLFLVPLSGWLYSSSSGRTTVYLGIWPLPNLVEKNEEFSHFFGGAHAALNWFMAVLVVLHILAALWHLHIKKDGVVKRMLPW